MKRVGLQFFFSRTHCRTGCSYHSEMRSWWLVCTESIIYSCSPIDHDGVHAFTIPTHTQLVLLKGDGRSQVVYSTYQWRSLGFFVDSRGCTGLCETNTYTPMETRLRLLRPGTSATERNLTHDNSDTVLRVSWRVSRSNQWYLHMYVLKYISLGCTILPESVGLRELSSLPFRVQRHEVGTLAVNGSAVTFGTARKGLGGD